MIGTVGVRVKSEGESSNDRQEATASCKNKEKEKKKEKGWPSTPLPHKGCEEKLAFWLRGATSFIMKIVRPMTQ